MKNELCSHSHRWLSRKKTATILPQAKNLLITTALLALGTQGAFAACGSLTRPLLPSTFAAQPQPLLQERASDSTSDDSAHRSSDKLPSMTGLWKTVYVSGGAVINVGFNIWHSDGTEWALDSLSPPFQGNTCAGVWEQTGRRTFKTLHPAYNYDAA